MKFEFSIGRQEYEYNCLVYCIDIEQDHTLWWTVLKPGSRLSSRSHLERQIRLAGVVDEDPKGAIEWAHESARGWIDNYVTTHLLLQEATEEANQLFENERVIGG